MIKRYFITCALVNQLEKRLAEMSLAGYKLIKITGNRFEFIHSEPKKRRYFCYIPFDASKDCCHDFAMAQDKYAGRIIKTVNARLSVFEVDPIKEDDEFNAFIQSRNQCYLKKYKWLSICLLAMFIGFSVLCAVVGTLKYLLLAAIFVPLLPIFVLTGILWKSTNKTR